VKDSTLSRVSAFAEIISSIAILLTLFYLATQTRELSQQTEQNTAALFATSRQQSLDTELELIQILLDHSDNELLRNSVSSGFGNARAKDEFELSLYYLAGFRAREAQWQQYQSGALDEASWQVRRQLLVASLRGDPTRAERWRANAPLFDPGFVADIEAELSRSDTK